MPSQDGAYQHRRRSPRLTLIGWRIDVKPTTPTNDQANDLDVGVAGPYTPEHDRY